MDKLESFVNLLFEIPVESHHSLGEGFYRDLKERDTFFLSLIEMSEGLWISGSLEKDEESLTIRIRDMNMSPVHVIDFFRKFTVMLNDKVKNRNPDKVIFASLSKDYPIHFYKMTLYEFTIKIS